MLMEPAAPPQVIDLGEPADAPVAPSPPASVLIKKGWLTKEGAFVKSWKLNWFELTAKQVTYYTDEVRPIHLFRSVTAQTRAVEASKRLTNRALRFLSQRTLTSDSKEAISCLATSNLSAIALESMTKLNALPLRPLLGPGTCVARPKTCLIG